MNSDNPERWVEKPLHRSRFRAGLGMWAYGVIRRIRWLRGDIPFAKEQWATKLPYIHADHKTPLLRKLKDVDMWYQYNKITNLKKAVPHLDGVVLRPGTVLSFWKRIGKPSRRKGYVPGMVLNNGGFEPGVGGGLCQLSNLIFWMTLHTPLTVVERHRHGYDVFPDANRTQPFGSGATCYYPHGDLMIRNDTDTTFQLNLRLDERNLYGAWHADVPAEATYRIVERNHEMRSEYWGGYSRRNELYRQAFDPDGTMTGEELLVQNAAIMMYAPFLGEQSETQKGTSV